MSIFLLVSLCLRVFSLVCHSGKDNHKLADGENMSRWTVCVFLCRGLCLVLAVITKGSSGS